MARLLVALAVAIFVYAFIATAGFFIGLVMPGLLCLVAVGLARKINDATVIQFSRLVGWILVCLTPILAFFTLLLHGLGAGAKTSITFSWGEFPPLILGLIVGVLLIRATKQPN